MYNRVTANQLARMKILLGLNGEVLTNPDYIRKFLAVPGRFKTYKYPEMTRYSKRAHCIDLPEIKEWNNMVKSCLAKKAKMIKLAKTYL